MPRRERKSHAMFCSDAADLIRNILVLDPMRRLSLKQILSHPFFTRPSPTLTRRPTFSRTHSYSSSISSMSHQVGTAQMIQEEFSHPPAILEQEETNLTSSPQIGFLGAEISQQPDDESDVPKSSEGDESASQSSHVGTTSQPRTTTSSPLTSVEGQDDQATEVLREVDARKRFDSAPPQEEIAPTILDQPTILPSPGRLSAPPSPVPPAPSSFDAPSLRRNRSTSSSVRSLPFHSGSGTHGTCTPHARTPARTKRRSIGSIISERLVSLVEEDPSFAGAAGSGGILGGANTSSPSSFAGPSPLVPSVDYLAIMLSTIHRDDLFSSEGEKDLLKRLNQLGFDTGQMQHSVSNSACDSSSATFWMLKKKVDEKEAERVEAEAVASVAATASVSGETETPIRNPSGEKGTIADERRDVEPDTVLELPATRVQEPTPTQDVFSTERVPSPPTQRSKASPTVPVTATVPTSSSLDEDRLGYFLGQHTSNAPPTPEYFPTIDPGSPTRRRTRSRDELLMSPRSGQPALVPLESPLELSPTSKARTEEEARNRRSRSGSVTLLARATSALNNSLNLKAREESPGSEDASGGLFRRKSSLPLDELASASNRTTPPLPSTSAPDSPRRDSSHSPFRGVPATPPRPTSTNKPIVSPGPSPSGSLANSFDTLDTVGSSSRSTANARSSTGGNGGSKKGTKGSQLLANLKFWFGEGQRKRNKSRSSPARAGEGVSYATGVGRSHSLNAGTGGYRVPPQSGYVASPLRRPLAASRRSSNASLAPLSRRSSVSSAHRAALHDQLARPQLAHHRRRSDSSRTSISGGERSRPQSLRSFNGGGAAGNAGPGQQQGSPSDGAQGSRRARHSKAHSTSSAGSFGKEAVYRRPPTTTTVRRRHPSHGRHNHRRSASGTSSIRTHRSSTSSLGGGSDDDDDAFGDGGEAPILEEDETEDREPRGGETAAQSSEPHSTDDDGEEDVARDEARLRALRTLSGDFSALQSTSSSSSGSSAAAIVPTASSSHLFARPPLTHQPSSRASSRSDASSATRSHHHHHHPSHATFSAHKSTHLFGSPLQPSSSSSTRKSAPPPSRPPLRDVFASKSTIGGESDWIDEDELEGYGGGLGQGNASTSGGTHGGSGFNASTSSLGTLDELKPFAAGGGNGGDSPIAEKTFGGGGGMSLFEGRYAGVNGSGNGGSSGSGVNGRGVRTLSAIKTVVIEEDEEEEEEEE